MDADCIKKIREEARELHTGSESQNALVQALLVRDGLCRLAFELYKLREVLTPPGLPSLVPEPDTKKGS